MQLTYRTRNIFIAVVLAAVAALLTTFYVTNYKRHVRNAEDNVTVLVAKSDIPAGTAGAEAARMLRTEEVPRRSVVPGAVSSPGQISELVASEATFAEEQITTRRFTSLAQNGVRGQLKGVMRAYQIEGDQNQTLAGVLRDGDRVDVVAAVKVRRGTSDLVLSRIVVRDLEVLRAPAAPPPGGKLTGGVGQTYPTLLAVSDNQAQKLQLILAATSDASSGSGWHLQLRPIVRANDSPDHLDSVRTVLTDGLSPSQRRVFNR